jgi:hypothetical protein
MHQWEDLPTAAGPFRLCRSFSLDPGAAMLARYPRGFVALRARRRRCDDLGRRIVATPRLPGSHVFGLDAATALGQVRDSWTDPAPDLRL